MESTDSLEEELFFDGSLYYEGLIKDISLASRTIDFETYIFEADKVGYQVADALREAAGRGVQVRLLIDGFGSPFFPGNLLNQLENAGAQVRIFHPWPWNFWQWRWAASEGVFISKLKHLLNEVNRRNHRKVCCIDKKIAWIGSYNVSKAHLPVAQGGYGWRDSAVRLKGTDLSELETAFDRAWCQERFSRIKHLSTHNPVIRLNYSRKRRRILYKNLLKRMSLCTNRIWITNAYFLPDAPFLNRLKQAAMMGVDVKILLPGKSDVAVIPWTSALFYSELISAGVRIFEYTPSVLHAKTLIFDDWMTVGSTNLNNRSFLHDLEVDVLISTTKSRTRITQQFLDDISKSIEINIENIRKRPLWQRAIGRLILYVKYFF